MPTQFCHLVDLLAQKASEETILSNLVMLSMFAEHDENPRIRKTAQHAIKVLKEELVNRKDLTSQSEAL